MKHVRNDRSILPRRQRTTSPREDAAARATRARDHLEKQRQRERDRRHRERRREDRRATPAPARSAVGVVLFGVALVLGTLSSEPFYEFFVMRPTALEEVAVQGAVVLTPAAIAARTGLIAGTPLAEIDPEILRDTVALEPWIASARTLRLPSGTVLVSIVERKPVARWQAADSQPMELIDRSGLRFAADNSATTGLPLVRGPLIADETDDAPMGSIDITAGGADTLPTEAIQLLAELRRYPSFEARRAQLTLHLPGISAPDSPERLGSEAGYVIQIGEQGPRALLGHRLLPQRIARLAALLESEEPTLERARWIDLRYADRAVLRPEEPPTSG